MSADLVDASSSKREETRTGDEDLGNGSGDNKEGARLQDQRFFGLELIATTLGFCQSFSGSSEDRGLRRRRSKFLQAHGDDANNRAVTR